MSANEEDDQPPSRDLTRTLQSEAEPREGPASAPPSFEEEPTQESAPEVITAPRSSRPSVKPLSLPPPPPSSPEPRGEAMETEGHDPGITRTLMTGVVPPLPEPHLLRKVAAFLAVAAVFLAIGAAFTLLLLR
jgi:hypothetical protein